MTLQDDIQLALKTWYPIDHPLHFGLDHPTIKLAGEAGEILDLYGKHKYKPNFDWGECKVCGDAPVKLCEVCVPLVLDELGDWWYYWRILAYLSDIDSYPDREVVNDAEYLLSDLNYVSALVRITYLDVDEVIVSELFNSFCYFKGILHTLDVTLEEITQLNYQKLNSEKTSHGWKGA